MRSFNRILYCLSFGISAFFAGMHNRALANPVVPIGPIIDLPTDFQAVFGCPAPCAFGGGLFPIVLGGVNWIANFDVAEVNGGFGVDDTVTIVGTMPGLPGQPPNPYAVRHLVNPDPGDAFPTRPMPLSITFDANGLPVGQNIVASFAAHPGIGHGDLTFFGAIILTNNARGGADPGLDIVDWRIAVRAKHVPEPSIVILVGLASVFLIARRRWTHRPS